MKDAILTVDIGTSNCKSTLFSADGEELARSVTSYETVYPRSGWAEQRPDDWWQAVISTVKVLTDKYPGMSQALAAISVTGQMHGLVCLDATRALIAPCLTLHDRRSRVEVEHLRASIGERTIYRLTGARLDPSLPIAKLLWLFHHEPDVFAAVRVAVACKDYVRMRMTGNVCTDPMDAAATGLMDLERCTWSALLCEACNIGSDKLPTIRPAVSIDGPLTPAAAEALGLRPGIPVAVGAGDDVEVIGAGLLEPGIALEHLGTTGSLLLCTSAVSMNWEAGLELYPHLVPGLRILGGSTSSAGAALRWAAEVFDLDGPAKWSAWLSSLPTEPGPVFLPYLAGERSPVWAPDARGALLGLTLGHGRCDAVRGVFEGVACSLRQVLDALGGLGVHPTTIRIAGDPSDNDTWTQLRANVYGLPLTRLAYSDPTALGAMIVGAVAVGLYKDLSTAVAHVVRVRDVVAPVATQAGYYGSLYRKYGQLSRVCLSIPSWDAVDDG